MPDANVIDHETILRNGLINYKLETIEALNNSRDRFFLFFVTDINEIKYRIDVVRFRLDDGEKVVQLTATACSDDDMIYNPYWSFKSDVYYKEYYNFSDLPNILNDAETIRNTRSINTLHHLAN